MGDSPGEVAERRLQQIREQDGAVRAFAHLELVPPPVEARRGRLAGLTMAVKDVIDVAGLPTRFGSRAFADAPPAKADAYVVARLRAEGAIVLGKTKTTEMAYTDPTDTDNPAAPGHTPGGSSSGSAAAVAAGMVDLALGTQTVGSVCRPAAFCGVSAFKPTTGSLPLSGVAPLSPDFDTVGFLSRDFALSHLAWRICAGIEEQASSLSAPLTLGFLADPLFSSGVQEPVRQTLKLVRERLEAAGMACVDIDTHEDHVALRAEHRTIMMHEAARHHGALLEKADLLNPNWRGVLETGRSISRDQRAEAMDSLRLRRARLHAVLAGVDALVVPPCATLAPQGHASTGDAGLIVSWTVAGGPIAVLPVEQREGLPPSGIMVTAMPGTDVRLGAIASYIETIFKTAEKG